MNRVAIQEEREWTSLISRITAGYDWWTSSTKPIPERIWFQRFGLPLHEEDFEKKGSSHKGFLIRERNEACRSNSGFSEFKNDDEVFQISLDVRPLTDQNLTVKMVDDLYIVVIGEMKELEDDCEFSLKFSRRYMLPRGCAQKMREPECVDGILKIIVDKLPQDEKQEKPRPVKITLEGSVEDEIHPKTVDAQKVSSEGKDLSKSDAEAIANGDSKDEEMNAEMLNGESRADNSKRDPTSSVDCSKKPEGIDSLKDSTGVETSKDELVVDDSKKDSKSVEISRDEIIDDSSKKSEGVEPIDNSRDPESGETTKDEVIVDDSGKKPEGVETSKVEPIDDSKDLGLVETTQDDSGKKPETSEGENVMDSNKESVDTSRDEPTAADSKRDPQVDAPQDSNIVAELQKILG